MKLENIDLTARIKINDQFQISIGRLLFVVFVTLIQFLAILSANGWMITTESIIIWSNMLLSLQRRYDRDELSESLEQEEN